MNNRFGFKDLIQLVMLLVVIIVMILGIVQYDRQWIVLRSIDKNLDAQARELAGLRRQIEQGIAVAPATGDRSSNPQATTQASAKDPFYRVKEARANPDYALGDWMVDAFPARIAKVTPYLAEDIYSRIFYNRVMESLCYQDPDTFEYLPFLATSWQISENGLTITFQLRKGVTFSDGHPMTADDVVFTYNFIMNPKIALPRIRSYVERIKSVEKRGEYEVVFKFGEPYFESFDLASGIYILPRHFYEQFAPETINQSTGLIMGTGPYKMKDPAGWKPGQRLELVRNERYWGEPGPFEKMVWFEVENETASLTMFTNGETDSYAATPEQYRQMLKDKNLLARTQHFEFLSPITGYTYIGWNQMQKGGRPSRFADKRVRQAMTMLIDRDRMGKEIMFGYAKTASGPFSSVGKQRDPEIEPWPFDPARAKALLKDAGFTQSADGVIKGPDGAPFTIKFTYPSKAKLSDQIALFVKDSLTKAGIAVDLDPSDWPLMVKKLKDRDFEVVTLGWSSAIESDIYQMFHSSQIQDNGDNNLNYINKDLDRLLEEARRTVDEQKRMPLWRQVHRILHEDQPYTFLLERKSLVFLDKRIRNVRESRVGLNYAQRWVMPIPWYVPKAEQKWTK